MSFFGPRLGSHLLTRIDNRKYITVIDEPDIEMGDYAEIQFYSQSGEYIDSITTIPEDAGYLRFELTVEKIGGLKKFEFETTKNLQLPFFQQMVVKFFINGNHWFTGELDYNPELDSKSGKLKFEGSGYFDIYLDQKIESELYENVTLDYIIRDIVNNYVISLTPIIYDADLIDVPNIMITKYEIENKEVSKVMEYLLSIANYDRNTQEYQCGVDKDKKIYFNEISTEVIDGWFEDHQFQKPEVKIKKSDIINRINIKRTGEASTDLEDVATIDDTESQEKYGIKTRTLEISDYIDDNSAEKIAQSIIEKNKEPLLSIDIDNIECESIPFETGFYNISNKVDYQKIEVDNCDSFNDWNITHIVNTDIEINGDIVLSGRRSIRIRPDTGSTNEYMDFTFDEEIYYPESLKFYLRCDSIGTFLRIICFDTDNNQKSFDILNSVANQYFPIDLDILGMENINKIRVQILADDNVDMFIDAFQVFMYGWLQRTECLQKIVYSFEKNAFLANATLGNDINDFIKELKKIEEKTDTIYDIIGRI